jgi:hypothetical protein
MNKKFAFQTDSDSEAYCQEIAREMAELFDIPESEAIGRMNRDWNGLALVGEDDVIYHDEPEYWAKTIYYGKDSFWWLKKAGLKPRPYP